MPLTFPSHLAPVLPLKLWRPHWFDGVALATGAVAPDVGYLFTGTRFDLGLRTHTLAGCSGGACRSRSRTPGSSAG